jgi:NADPH2:quinone reductase
MPRAMRALGFREHGDLSKLEVLDVPMPEPGPGGVRIRVHAAALNRLDLFVLKGWRGLDLQMPHIGGSDAAGVVEKVGEGVTAWRPGDRVVVWASLSCGHCAMCRKGEVSLCREHRLIGEHTRGVFAEHAVVPAANLKRVPEGFPFEQAAAASLAFLTAWRMLVTRARLRAGESVLVVGAGGGVNTAAIQIARLAGARPILVVGSTDAKLKAAQALGADHGILASAAWEKEVSRLTDKRGADVVVDNVGAATWSKSLRAAARGGRIVTVGGTTGYDFPMEVNQVFWKQLDVLGSTMGTRDEFDAVMDLVFAGRLKAVVDEVFPLERGPDAYRRLSEGKAEGKVVLRMA